MSGYKPHDRCPKCGQSLYFTQPRYDAESDRLTVRCLCGWADKYKPLDHNEKPGGVA